MTIAILMVILTLVKVALQRSRPAWIRRVAQSQAGRFVKIDAGIAVYYWLSLSLRQWVLQEVYFGLRGILSRFVYENGDYIRLKTELWYEKFCRHSSTR